MTDTAMPTGSDTVVMQEHVKGISDTEVRIASGHRKQQNVRQAGEDISRNSMVLPRGHALQPADLGVIASVGIGEISVYRRPKIAFFSTSDELRPVGETLDNGELYDSNRYSLHGRLSQLNVDIVDLGIVRYQPEELQQPFSQASSTADVVIVSGGVSVGEADFIKACVESKGIIHYWKIAMKPGRPLAFRRLGNAAFFGLPGNPVSVMTTFFQFALPAIQRMSGRSECAPLTIEVESHFDLKSTLVVSNYSVAFCPEMNQSNWVSPWPENRAPPS